MGGRRTDRTDWRFWQPAGKVAAVVLLVVVVPELLAVVASTDKVPLASSMTVMEATIARTIAVALTLIAGVLRCTAPPSLVVPTGAALAYRGFYGDSSFQPHSSTSCC